MEQTAPYSRILASMSSGIITTDSAGNINYINPKATSLLDLDPADITGLNIRLLFPESGRFINECLQMGNIHMGQYVIRGNRSLVIDIAPIQIETKIEGIVATLHLLEDFNDALRHSDGYLNLNKQLDAIFKGSSDGLWVHDSDGKIININTVSEMINGIRAKEVIGDW